MACCHNLYRLITDYTAGFGGKDGVQKEEPSRVVPVAAAKPTPGKISTRGRDVSYLSFRAEPQVAQKAPAVGNPTSGRLGGLLAK